MKSPEETARLIEQLSRSKWFRRIDSSIWGGLTLRLEAVHLAAGEALFHQDDPGDGIYVVLAGLLEAYKVKDDGGELPLAKMGAGATVGEIQVLTGGARTATVRAVESSELVKIPTAVFDELLRRSPETRREMVAVNERRLNRSLLAEALPKLFGSHDEETMRELQTVGTWREVRRGERLIQRGDPGESCYILLRGRLAAVLENEAGEEMIVGEIYRGEPVGEMALFTGEPHGTSVRALRDSRVIEIPYDRFEEILGRRPQMMMALVRVLVQRLMTTTAAHGEDGSDDGRRVSTVAVVPAAAGVPLTEVTARLAAALGKFGSTLHVNQQMLQELHGFRLQETQRFQIGAPADTRDDPAAMRLAAWLDEQELRHRFVIYESDGAPTGWTRRCTRQADVVLMVAAAGGDPVSDALELLPTGVVNLPEVAEDVARRTVLVLLHPDGRRRPRETGRWLDSLGLDRHVHLRQDRAADFERLARLLAGRAVALALGGGGSRAFAHIGVIRALEEAGIPIDAVGGTSAGSLIAAQYAMGWDVETMIERNRSIFLQGNPYRDLTLPFVSVLSGRRARGLLEKAFPDVDLEDLWLSCFAVSANLATAKQMIHRRGDVIDALYASMSIPGVAPPAVVGGDLLVDGGVLNNLPGDVARRLWGGRVISVDVSTETETRFRSAAGELPSAGAILKRRLSPFAEKADVPGILEILLRSSLLGSVQNTAVARAEADLYLKPPVGKYAMFNLHVLDQLVEIGYDYTRRQLEDWDG